MSVSRKEDITDQQMEPIAERVKGIMTSLNIPIPEEQQLQDQLRSIYRLMGILQKNLKNKKNAKLAKEYLQVAKQDLEAARLLNKKKIFSLSIYHLQQAIEKTAKCCGAIFFGMSKKDLKGYNHKSPLVFIEAVKKELHSINSLYSQNEDLSKTIEDAKDIINKSLLNIARLDKDKISQLLNYAQNIKKVTNKEEIVSVIFLIYSILSDDEKGESAPILLLQVYGLLNFVAEVINLYFLSILTYPHESYTRYPDGKMKPEDYNENLGIVQMCKDICNSLEKTQKMIETWLDKIRSWGEE